MSYIIPDPRFEMPELLTPKRKPTGEVVINWSHPITRKLWFCVVPIKNTLPPDLVTNTLPTITSGDSNVFSLTHGKYGGQITSTRSSGNKDLITYDVNYPALTNAQNFTGLIFFRWNGTTTNYQTGFALSATSYQIFYAPFVGSSANFAFYNGATAQSGTNILVSGKYNIYVCRSTFDGTFADVDFFNNGILHSSNNNSTVSLSGAITNFYIAGNSQWQDETMAGDFVSAMFWDRSLSNAEITSISRDPYQFLIPA